MNERLPVHEKLAVVIICLIFGLFLLVCEQQKEPILFEVEDEIALLSDEVEVAIFGYVENPGSYSVKIGTPVKDIIQLAHPKEGADLRKIDLEAPIVRKRTLTVRKKSQNGKKRKKK